VSPLIAVAVVVVGFGSGILSGMFGVGGAVLTTPGVRAAGATPIEAVGSTIPAILPGALSGAYRYSRAGMVDWTVALYSGLFGTVFAVMGAELSDHVDGHYLMLLTAAILLWTGLKNILEHMRQSAPVTVAAGATHVDARPADDPEPRRPSPLSTSVIGAGAGLLAGLLGVGGGILLVPAFVTILRMAPKRAVATSLVAVAMLSVPAMITHAFLGHINWAFAVLLVIGVVPGAQVGAKVTIHGSEERLRFLMGVFFTVLALAYGLAEIRAAF
jgi:uncharacterized membrane protein YfcA